MPLSALAEFVLQPVAEIVLQVVGYVTACVVVPAFTLGRIHVEPGPNKKFIKPRFGRLQRLPNGKLIMEAELASLVGLMFWVIVGLGAYFVFRKT